MQTPSHTRGTAPNDLEDWVLRRSFLKLPESEWPQFDDQTRRSQQEYEDSLKEMKTIKKAKKKNLMEMIGTPESFKQ